MIALTAPALADFTIVQGPDGHCRVVEHYNSRDRDTVRAGPLSFRDRAEGEREIKAVCKDGYYYQEESRREERREEKHEDS